MSKSVTSITTKFSDQEYWNRLCVFVSYKGNDIVAARDIAKALLASGIDVYFDEHDVMLTSATLRQDHEDVVKFIEDGVANSTHILAVVSDATKESWWVSFEIGSGRRNGSTIAYVALSDVKSLPSYLQIADKITSDRGLYHWIRNNLPTNVTKSLDFSEKSIYITRLPIQPREDITFY